MKKKDFPKAPFIVIGVLFLFAATGYAVTNIDNLFSGDQLTQSDLQALKTAVKELQAGSGESDNALVGYCSAPGAYLGSTGESCSATLPGKCVYLEASDYVSAGWGCSCEEGYTMLNLNLGGANTCIKTAPVAVS